MGDDADYGSGRIHRVVSNISSIFILVVTDNTIAKRTTEIGPPVNTVNRS